MLLDFNIFKIKNIKSGKNRVQENQEKQQGRDIFKAVLKIFKNSPNEKFSIENISALLGNPLLANKVEIDKRKLYTLMRVLDLLGLVERIGKGFYKDSDL